MTKNQHNYNDKLLNCLDWYLFVHVKSDSVDIELTRLMSAAPKRKQLTIYSVDKDEDGIPIQVDLWDTQDQFYAAKLVCKTMGLLEPERYIPFVNMCVIFKRLKSIHITKTPNTTQRYGIYIEIQDADYDNKRKELQTLGLFD